MKKANQIIYALFGAIAILLGVAVLVFPRLLTSEAERTVPMMHILREEAAAGVFIGLMSIWCIFNYEKRTAVHSFLIVYTFLMAAIHWFDYLTGHRPLMSPLVNSVPLIVLVLMAMYSRPQATVSEG
jgi:peptidoglycan/LPS O-acetylase OafA/YrhL